jgi:hypothetical protein
MKRGRKPRNKAPANKILSFYLTGEELSWLRDAMMGWQNDKSYSTESDYAREILLERIQPRENNLPTTKK